ncbi:MAG: SRPBCC family protein [Candidatus Woykebacteria bacterium]
MAKNKQSLRSSELKTKIVAEPGKQELFITRELDAPRDLVFKAYTDPKLYVQWLGPKGYKMHLEKFEPRSGGSWRYIQTDPEGNKWAFHGVIHEVLKPERIIDTFEFEGLPEKGHVILQTATFEELPGGRTKVTAQAVFQSVGDRDGMIQSGMEKGVNEGFVRLDEVLAKLKEKK